MQEQPKTWDGRALRQPSTTTRARWSKGALETPSVRVAERRGSRGLDKTSAEASAATAEHPSIERRGNQALERWRDLAQCHRSIMQGKAGDTFMNQINLAKTKTLVNECDFMSE